MRLNHWIAPMVACAVCGVAPLAAESNMLKPELKMHRPNDMAEKKFDTKSFQTRGKYGQLNEFKVGSHLQMESFKPSAPNKNFDREFSTSENGVFTGQAYLPSGRATEAFTGKAAGGFDGRYPVSAAQGLAAAAPPMGEQTYSESQKRYRGPELERKTTEVELINQTLRNKETLKGGVLSMEEVREILNKRE
jgi:hypothetical protein